jgi:phosphohistidine phosphatase
MELYLMRHGIAEEAAADGGDAARRLTDKGAHRVRQIAAAMRAMELEFDLILASPFRRARQTAEIVTGVLACRRRLKFSDHLAIPPNDAALIHQLNQHRPRPRRVLLVGHEPHLSGLTSLLLTGKADCRITFKKGGLAKLEVGSPVHGRCARLAWLLTPRQMLLMA